MRIKPPTTPIETDPEVLEAFNPMSQAGGLAANALAAYQRYTGGTSTSQKHYRRYEGYSLVEGEWRRSATGRRPGPHSGPLEDRK